MKRQFKQPFENPEVRPGEDSHAASIAEQETLKPPSVNVPITPNVAPPRGYVQGKYGQYGPGAPGQLAPDLASRPGGLPANALFPPRTAALPGGSGPMAGAGPASWGGVHTPNPAWSEQAAPSNAPRKDPAYPGKGRKGKKRRRVPIWARVVIGLLSVLLLLGGGGWWYYQANFAGAINSITGKNFTRARGESNPDFGKTGSVLNWGRINILLLGSDTDEKTNWSGNRFLAQTVMVVTIDPGAHDVGILSIPRDFWIPIPGYAYHDKLDTAFAYGGSVNKDMSGVGEVVLTLDQDFGIPINFYAWVGLDGFVKVIDTVGGVDVDVMHPIVDDTYPDDVGNHSGDKSAYKRLYIPDGPQHLDGPTALEYVRSRHSTTDFNRSARQQEVLGALKFKLENPGIFNKLPEIANDLVGSVYTQLKPDQIFDLARFARGVDPNKIRHLTLGPPYSHGGTVNNQDVVFPDCAAIVPKIDAFLHITTGKCNIAYNSQGLPQVASAPPPPAPVWGTPAARNAQAGSLLADAGLPGPLNVASDLFGLRDVLDLMSLVVLDSPQL